MIVPADSDTPEAEASSPIAVVPEAPMQAPAVPGEHDRSGADPAQLPQILEALLLAADAPLTPDQLQRMLAPEYSLSRAELRAALAELAQRLEAGATVLAEVASGWRVQVRAQYAGWVSRLWTEKPARMTRAALETLALVVYRQPITRGEIEDIRGVAVSANVMRGLLERGWIREIGHKEVPGRPALFGTTPQFLDDFGLKSLEQLPALPEIKDVAQLEAALARLMPGEVQSEQTDAADGDEAVVQQPSDEHTEQAHAGEA